MYIRFIYLNCIYWNVFIRVNQTWLSSVNNFYYAQYKLTWLLVSILDALKVILTSSAYVLLIVMSYKTLTSFVHQVHDHF